MGALTLEPALPTGREEEWRFTPLGPLRALLAGQAPTEEPGWQVSAPEGVQVLTGTSAGPRLPAGDLLSERVRALAPGTDAVRIPPGVTLAEPVVVTVTGRGGLAYRDLVVEVGARSEATLVLDHRGAGTLAADVDLHLGTGARLEVLSVQDWAPGAVHAGAHTALVGRDASLRMVTATLGGALVRLRPEVRFDGPGGAAELSAVVVTGAGQHHEHRLRVVHEPPSCRSQVTYKVALHGAGAHSVWVGDVVIGAGARGTDTYEVNRNLVLTPGARADSVPNLEIATGDVARAGHASATGRFDDEQLFYLMARGLTEREARRLVVRGFFAEVLERVSLAGYRDRLAADVQARLEEAGR